MSSPCEDRYVTETLRDLKKDSDRFYDNIKNIELSMSKIEQILINIIGRNDAQDKVLDTLYGTINDLDTEIQQMDSNIQKIIGEVERDFKDRAESHADVEDVKEIKKVVDEMSKVVSDLSEEVARIKEIVNKNESFFTYDRRAISKGLIDENLKKYGVPAIIVGILAGAITAIIGLSQLLQKFGVVISK